MKLKQLLQKVGRKLNISTTKGKPNIHSAPVWAKFIGVTPNGAYHWLSNKTVVENDKSDKYFPDAKKIEFTGFSEDKKTKAMVVELSKFK